MSPSRVMRTVRKVPKETVVVRPFSAVSGKGVVTFGAAVNVEARVLRDSRDYMTSTDGTKIRLPVILYVEGDADYLPKEKDRVELDGANLVVGTRTEPRRLGRTRDEIGHVRLACRLE